jgi:hypothetical protein
MANTSWNPSDKTAQAALSNSNLTVTFTSSGTGNVVRTVDRALSGKYYWEYTLNTLLNNITSWGVATQTLPPVVLVIGVCPSACIMNNTGQIYINSVTGAVYSGYTCSPTPTSGSVIGIALDMDRGLIWFRSGAAGLWNGNANADPAIGAGGINLDAIITAFGYDPAYPVVGTGTGGVNGDAITANFGDSAFAGAVPAGFTSGFPQLATPPLNMGATQVPLEDWMGSTPIRMNVTQVAAEEWGSVITGATQYIITQVVIEEWAAVVAAAPVGAQARVQVMA